MQEYVFDDIAHALIVHVPALGILLAFVYNLSSQHQLQGVACHLPFRPALSVVVRQPQSPSSQALFSALTACVCMQMRMRLGAVSHTPSQQKRHALGRLET